MRTALFGLLLALWMLAGSIPSAHATTPIGAIMGGAVNCVEGVGTCTPPPLSASLLCDGTGAILDCPQFFAPDWAGVATRFFGLTNRTNPPRCVQSTDGGSVWGLCPTNPFSAVIDVFGASFGVATDGSLIVAADQGANNCIIRRSTDYGANWSTVYTETTAGLSCGIGFGNPTMNNVRCSDTSGYCLLIARGPGAFEEINYFSTDNGANWTKSTSFTLVSGDPEFHIRFGPSDESAGVLVPGSVTFGSTIGAVKSGNVFVATSAIPTPPGSGTGSRCAASASVGSTRMMFCGGDSINVNNYKHFDVLLLAPTFINYFTLPDAPAFANSPDISAIGFSSSIIYLQGRSLSSGRIRIYISVDSGASFVQIADILPATVLIAGCCRGDWWVRSGKIYFTIGGTSSNAVFGRIQ